MRLLIVDDLEEYTESIAFILEDYFETVHTVSTMTDAKKVFNKDVPDVAVIDIRLAENDHTNKEGLELLNWIKENNFKTKVVMISAYRDFDYAVEALNAGADYFLKKPVKNSELEKIIRELTHPVAETIQN